MRCLAWLLIVFLPIGCRVLPIGGERHPSTAMTGNGRTMLATAVRLHTTVHPGQSGLHPLENGRDAFAARLFLADAAQRCLDVQYYIWKKDMAGRVLTARLLQAADRGVRVRLLLDDLGTMPSDEVLAAVDSHPNIEVRMFNPVAMRSLRLLGIVADFKRINRRMHNKCFIADGHVAIVGGRNIGDQYFDAHAEANFADLDLAVIGPVVDEASAAFDLYWNHQTSIPVPAFAQQNVTAGELAGKRTALSAHDADAARSPYAASVRDSEFARELKNRSLSWLWGKASIVSDHPDKIITSDAATDTHLAPKLGKVMDATKRELFLVSPYFVPGKEGVTRLAEVRRRGVRVVVVTNSLASTGGAAVHSGYQRYREALIRAGIELYEIKPTASARRERKPPGSSSASLHAKTFSFDRRIGYIGSYNLDPRSNKLNTEMGVLFDCPVLASRLPESLDLSLEQNAWRLELEDGRLVWVTREGEKLVRLYSEPEAGSWKRFKVRVLSWLPIENQL